MLFPFRLLAGDVQQGWNARIQASRNLDAARLAILGLENLNTTARYTKRTQQQLADGAEKLNY